MQWDSVRFEYRSWDGLRDTSKSEWDVRRPRAIRATKGTRTLGPRFVSFPVPGLSLRLAPSSRVATSASSAERFLPTAVNEPVKRWGGK